MPESGNLTGSMRSLITKTLTMVSIINMPTIKGRIKRKKKRRSKKKRKLLLKMKALRKKMFLTKI